MQVALEGSELLTLTGPDAVAFAQAQFMSDCQALAVGDWQWSGWLTPKGRLVAFFALIRSAEDHLLLWLPAGGAEALRAGLQRFVFRSRLKIDVLAQARAIGVLGSEAEEHPAIADIELPTGSDGEVRRLRVIDADSAISLASDPGTLARWRLADLRLGVPYIAAGAGNSEQFVPQWLSLERLSAYSLKKGCYPGQEIIARMHYLGQSKRAAWRLAGAGDAPAAMARVLTADGTSVGEIVWAQTRIDGNGWQALAVLAVDKADSAAQVEGVGAVRLVQD